jgi:hypothetical protein
MKLQVGEQVRFLNEAIDGTVTKILNNDRVEVTDEFGFTHTAPEKFLVRVEFHLPEKDFHRASKFSEEQEESTTKKSRSVPPQTIATSLENDETIYAAVSLVNKDSPLSSDIELRLINNCGNSIAFTAAKKNDNVRIGVTAGVLKPKNELLIGVYSQDELYQFDGFAFQFLFFNEELFKPRPPAEKSLKFSSSDFVEGDHWETIKFRDQKTLLMPLYVIGKEASVDLNKLIEKYQVEQEEVEKKRKADAPTGRARRGEKFVILNKEKVVDLHIDSLLKDYNGMSNSQIIVHQLNHFLYEMDQAILKHYQKIIFIHGVGEGVLKSAIREELKKFPNIKFADAPVEKFGYGATEVNFS